MEADDTSEFFDPGRLSDGVISLALAKTTPADPANNEVPTYHFAITRVDTGTEIGGINLRVGLTAFVVMLRGQVGYTIEESHRGRGFATRACRLQLPLARKHGFTELWATCDPENVASRKTLDALGATLVETVPVPPDSRMYSDGSRQKCRYRIAL